MISVYMCVAGKKVGVYLRSSVLCSQNMQLCLLGVPDFLWGALIFYYRSFCTGCGCQLMCLSRYLFMISVFVNITLSLCIQILLLMADPFIQTLV